MRTTPPRRLGLTATVLAVACTAATLAPAQAADGTPPVAVADSTTMYPGTMKTVAVLANDSDADGDDLAVCRLEDVPDGLMVFEAISERDGQAESLKILALEAGTYTFTYFACDHDYLAEATVTVVVKKAPPMRIEVRKLANRPGKLRVVNRGTTRVLFMWGEWDAEKEDGKMSLARKSAEVITVRRRSIFWIAANRYASFRVGAVRGIALPRGVKALAPGAPSPKELKGIKQELTSLAVAGRRVPWVS